MANRHRGEIEACLDGRAYTLCLTLGALAELESAFGEADMLALAMRFEKGRMSASDAQRIIGAGLRGSGHDISNDDVAAMQVEGAAAGFVAIVANLLRATFSNEDEDSSGGEQVTVSVESPSPMPGEVHSGGPFPGTT